MSDQVDFVTTFRELPERGQKRRAYEIAEKYASKFARPANVSAMADGIRAAVLGEPMAAGAGQHERKGYGLGRLIREGELVIEP